MGRGPSGTRMQEREQLCLRRPMQQTGIAMSNAHSIPLHKDCHLSWMQRRRGGRRRLYCYPEYSNWPIKIHRSIGPLHHGKVSWKPCTWLCRVAAWSLTIVPVTSAPHLNFPHPQTLFWQHAPEIPGVPTDPHGLRYKGDIAIQRRNCEVCPPCHGSPDVPSTN